MAAPSRRRRRNDAALLLLAALALFSGGASALRRDAPSSLLRSAERIVEVGAVEEDAYDHARSKRDTDEQQQQAKEAVSEMASAFHLNNSHLSLMVNWVGKDSSVVFCLARDQKMEEGATSNLYMSEDYGTNFADISSRFKLESGANAVIARYYHHPRSSCRYVFADTINQYIFTSSDCGKTVKGRKVQMVPDVVEFDAAVDGDAFLVHDLQGDQKSLFVTTDFGETFSHVQDYVKAFFFKELEDKGSARSVLYVQRLEPPGNRSSILSSTNYFQRQVDTTVIFSGAHEFELRGDFMFVTKPKAGNPEELDLLISQHGERFVPADFGLSDNDLVSLDYHIIDVTEEGQVLVCVNHGSALSNLYASARITPYVVEFSLSLERVMYYNPNVTWTDSWLSDTAGDEPFADVYKVKGLRGIYVASQISEEAMGHEDIQPQDLTSLITFDQGGVWTKIQGPETDEEGFKYPGCEKGGGGGGCSLHVSQQLSKRFPSTRSIPLLSSESAVGIVMATGNVGRNLSQKSDVFLSADAGLSWHQMLKGSYYFNIGDHGGVIAAVKYYKTEGRTDELLYSTDDGLSWQSLKFYHEPLRVFGLLTEPGENTTIFTMFGTASSLRGGSSIDWIIVKVDLRAAFERECTRDDYKRWSPADGTRGKHRNCILGRKEVYERRVVRSHCYSGREYERVVTVENCGCDRSDYQCDFGFRPEGLWTDGCVKDPKFDEFDAYAAPANCPEGEFYNRTRGYIKIRGDTCSGGLAKRFEPAVTLCPVDEEKEFLLVSQREAIVRINLRDLADVQTLPLQNVKNVITLEFDIEDNCVMYGDIEVDKIFIQCLNGSEPRVLVNNDLESVEGMAYDWITKTLYFVDGSRKTIELVRVDLEYEGRMRKTVLSGKQLSKPRGLAVHPAHGYLYFSDWNEDRPRVARANMDGSEVKVLQTSPHVQWPNGLSIDYIANRVYWVDAREDYIASCDLDGNNFKKVLSRVPQIVHPFAVAVHKEMMYWDDWNRKAIYMADKNSGKKIHRVRQNMNGSMDLKVFSSAQHNSGGSACSSNPCSHLCVPMPGGRFRCLCPDGMKASSDESGSSSLVCRCPDGSVPESNGTCHQSADGRCDQSHFTCRNRLCVPAKWQCDGDDDCGDGSDEESCARDQCLDFQFQCDNKHCIPDYWKCDFDDDCGDGSDERNCIKSECGADQFRCDNGQCISKKWQCDMEKDCQDGSDERGCLTQAPRCKPEEFHCPGGGQCLPTSWKCDGDRDCPDGSDEEDCAHVQCKDYQFACGSGGGCVFDTWRCDGTSDCPDGSDEANCTEIGSSSERPDHRGTGPRPVFPKGKCNQWMFKCSNEECIPYWWKCDGTPDCSDASDELECHNGNNSNSGAPPLPPPPPAPPSSPASCSDSKFRCNSGQCVWQAWVCDDDEDCEDGSDESEEVCADVVRCSQHEYRCELSGECMDSAKLCDGKRDCADGSDETGCDGDDPEYDDDDDTYYEDDDGTPHLRCQEGEFSCDNGGYCIPASKQCNGVVDCYDGTDELHCQLPSRIGGIQIDSNSVTASTVRLNWWIADSPGRSNAGSGSGGVKFRPCYQVSGTDLWTCSSDPLSAEIFDHEFTNLQPYTEYNFTVRLVGGDDQDHESGEFASARTSSAPPSAPRVTAARQTTDGRAFVSWTRPAAPNGEMRSYVVLLSPAGREWQVGPGRRNATLDFDFVPGRTYGVSVTAVNEAFHGEASEEVQLVFGGKDSLREMVEGLTQLGAGKNNIFLKWDSPRKGSSIREFKVRVSSVFNFLATYPDMTVDPSRVSNVSLSGLAPGEAYSVSVSAVGPSSLEGPASKVRLSTRGDALPTPNIIEAKLTSKSRTAVHLVWATPEGNADASEEGNNWEYGIFHGASMDEVRERKNKVKMISGGARSATVDLLNACQSYTFVVAVAGPSDGSFGRPSEPKTVFTKYSPGAPPKDLRAVVSGSNMTVTWSASCPEVDEPIAYLLEVEDEETMEVSTVKVAETTSPRLSHFVDNVHYGARYSVKVRTAAPGASSAGPVRVSGPPIPSPRGLTHHIAHREENDSDSDSVEQLIYWHKDKPSELPPYLSRAGYSYRLIFSENPDLSVPSVFDAPAPPFDVSAVVEAGAVLPGRLYYVAVALVDGDGYASAPSDPVALETALPAGDVVVSRTSVAAILIPILVLLALLGAGLAYYVRKNRRLTRSFQALTSRYSAASGAAILNQGDLEEVDDSPIIRGFADDEPLVVT